MTRLESGEGSAEGCGAAGWDAARDSRSHRASLEWAANASPRVTIAVGLGAALRVAGKISGRNILLD